MAKSKRAPLSQAQLEIMNLVWDRGEVTVAEIWQELCKQKKVVRNTVQTTLVRLEEKGWLKHRVKGNAHYYSARSNRKGAITKMATRLIDTAFEGSAANLVMALVEAEKISNEDVQRIREMIEERRSKK